MDELRQFIHNASKKTYASGDENLRKKNDDGSTTIVYEEGDYRYHDNYFGGEPYGGREVVFHKGKPLWMMVYYGWVVEGIDSDEVYGILTKALSNSALDMPYRGPKEYIDGDLKYVNNMEGDVENFKGEEKILKGDTLLYTARYIGGLVDRRG